MSSVLLIGLGNMGRKYLQKFSQLGLKPTLCDINSNLQEEFKNYNFYCFYDDVKDKPEKVFVMVNPEKHTEIAKHFLSKGSYVFLEKPPSLSFEDFRKLIEEFGKENLGVSEIERYSYAVKGFSAENLRVEKIEIYRLNRGKGYINPIWDLAWHDFYLLLYLFGDFEIENLERKGKFFYTLKGFVKDKIPFELNVAWNYQPVRREWVLKTNSGELVLDFLNERRLENGKEVSKREEKDKLLEMVSDVLKGKYDTNSVERALKILKELERLKIS